MLSGLHDVRSINASLEAGAVGYLAKPITMDYCLVNLRVAVCGTTGIKQRSPESESVSPVAHSAENGVQLTNREIEVLELLTEGLLYKEIADRLGMSYSTVHKHQHRIFQKLQVSNRAEAIRKWARGGRHLIV
jgi:NarL family two-component system response regulator LiaR